MNQNDYSFYQQSVDQLNKINLPEPSIAATKAATLQDKTAQKAGVTDEDVYLKGMQQRFDVLGQLNTQDVDLISQTMREDGTGNIFGTDKPLSLPIERATDDEVGYFGRPLSNVRGIGGEDLYTTMNTPQEDSDYYSKYADKPIQSAFEPATLRSLLDADTYSIEGVTGGKGRGADKTGMYTPDRLTGVDAYEIPHEGSVNASPEKMARQREALARSMGIPQPAGVDWSSVQLNRDVIDSDGMLGESADIAQSSLVQQYGKTNKVLREMSRWGVDKLGLDQETIDAWLPATDKVGTIGFGETPSSELAKREIADKFTGVMVKTREEQDAKMADALSAVEKGNYGEAALDTFTIMPYILGDSAGEIAALMSGYPGLALAVSARVNEDAEEYERNNDGKKADAQWLIGSTLSNTGVLIGEQLIVGRVIKGLTKNIGSTLAHKGKHAFYNALGETAQEYADQTQQMYMTQKEGSRTLGEVATGPEAQLAALTGGAMGATIGSAGVAAAAGMEGVKRLDEKITATMGSQTDPNQVTKPISTDGKNNMWESVSSPEFEVVDPVAKDTYTETIAEFAIDMLANPKLMKKYGYVNQSTNEAGESIDINDNGRILEDALEKISKVQGLTDPKYKEVAKYMLVNKVSNYFYQKSTETGVEKVDPEVRATLMQDLARFVEGDKAAELELVGREKAEIRATFDAMLDEVKVRDSLGKYALSDVEGGDLLAKLAVIDEEQYARLKKAVVAMKTMGSSKDSTIPSIGAEIEKSLDILREKAKTLGSTKDDGTDTTNTERIRKTYQEVADEIENVGFLAGSVYKKSIKEHRDAVETYVGKEGVPQAKQDSIIAELDGFIGQRGINKVWGFRSDKGTRVLNRINGIRNILNSKIKENEKLLKLLNDKVSSLEKVNVDQALIEKFTKMRDELAKNQADHKAIAEKAFSTEPAIQKQVYYELNKTATNKFDEAVIAEELADESKWSAKGGYETEAAPKAKVEEKSAEYEAMRGDTTGTIPKVAEPTLELDRTEVDSMSKEELTAELGKVNEDTPEAAIKYGELKTRLDTLEKEKKSEPVKDKATKKPKFSTIEEGKSEYKTTVKGDETGVIPKTLAEQKEELKTELKKATTYTAWVEKQIDSHIAKIKNVKTKRKVLRELQVEYLKDINKAKKELESAKEKLASVEAIKGRIDAAPENVFIKIMQRFTFGMKQLKNVVAGLKSAVTRLRNKMMKLEDAEYETAAEIGLLDAELAALGKKLGMLEKEKKKAKVYDINPIRLKMEEKLGELVTPNKSDKQSISTLLYKGAEISEIMKLMPNIIQGKNGIEMVGGAQETLAKFAETRYRESDANTKYKWFTKQVSDTESGFNYNNPLMELTVNGKKISFNSLWELTPEEIQTKDKDLAAKTKKEMDAIRAVVKNAMDVTSIVTLKAMIDTRMSNSELVGDVVDNGFGSLWANVAEDNRATEKRKVKNALWNGKYVPEAMFRENAGRMLLEQLELKLGDIEGQDRSDLISALGVMVINNLLPAGKVNGELVHEKRLPDMVRRGVVTVTDDVVEYKDPEELTGSADEVGGAVRVINLEALTKDYIKEISAAATVFEFASEKNHGTISLEPVKVKDGATIKNSDTPLPESVIEHLNKEGARPQKFVGLGKIVEQAKVDAGKVGDYAQIIKDAMLGTEAELLQSTQAMGMESKIAKFRAEELVIDRMLMAYELVGGDGKEFYLGWDYTVSGRSMMSNKLVNPQASGISRFLVAGTDMVNTIDTATIKQAEIDHLELAIAQAVGIGIDKTSHKNALDELHKEFIQIVKVEGKLTLKFGKNKKLADLVNDKNFNLGNVRKVDEEVNKDADTEPTAELEIGSKTIMHLAQAVELLRDINKGEPKVETNLALEADGITNGMALLLMQMGWNDFSKGMLKRAGVYSKGDEVQNHGDYKDEGGKDIYESPIGSIQKSLKEDMTKQLEEILGTNWRNFMKDPVMLFIYGANTKNITKAVAESIVVGNSYIKGGLADGKIDQLLKFAGVQKTKIQYKKYVINEETGRPTAVTLSKNEDGYGDAHYAVLSDPDVARLTKAIHKKIEGSFASGFEKTFEEVIEFRQTLKTVEEVNYTLFKIAFQRKVKELAKNKFGALTSSELLKIKTDMMKEGTYYSTTSAVDGTIDYWKTDKSDTDLGNGRISVTINTNDFQSQTGGFAKTYNQIVKDLKANVGAIGVTTIHALDGSIMIEGQIDAVLNVYDALVMGSDLGKNTKQIQKMNEKFYEISARHSILGAAVEKMVSMLDLVKDAEIDNAMAKEVRGDLNRIYAVYDGSYADSLVNGTMEVLARIDENRETLTKESLTVGQYAAATDVAGIDSDTVLLELDGKRYKVYGVSKDAEMAKVREGLEWLVNGATNIEADVLQETPQQREGIISEIKSIVDSMPPNLRDKMTAILNNPEYTMKDC